ncbi:MAG: asparaginase [Proteobacteria bacterium]|nr:asparaginase [Pseudomonadota bacterium]
MTSRIPRLLVLSLGGTITMVPQASGGIVPVLGAADLIASIPALAGLAEIETESPARVPSASLDPATMAGVAIRIHAAFAAGFDGAVVIQGTDTIEESAFLLDLLVNGDRPVVVTGAMRGAEAAGADGPANLFAAVRVAASEEACGLGALVVLNDEIHAARLVQKGHTALPSAFRSPLAGPVGAVVEGRPRIWARPPRMPRFPAALGAPPPVALIRWAMGEDGRLLGALAGLGYAGAVIEGMGAGHVPAAAVDAVAALARQMPVVLASRCDTGPVFTRTYGYAGGEIDLIRRGAVPGGMLSGPKARLLLGLALRESGANIADCFAPYS